MKSYTPFFFSTSITISDDGGRPCPPFSPSFPSILSLLPLLLLLLVVVVVGRRRPAA